MLDRAQWVVGGAVALSAGVLAGTFSCGGSDEPACGDGIHQPDRGEQCDDGNNIDDDNCRNNCTTNLPGEVTISWAFNKDAAPMFSSDGCIDMGVRRVSVEVIGPATDMLDESCSLRQVVFQDLPSGSYLIRLRPVDQDDMLMTNEPIEATMNLQSGAQVEINIPPTEWKNSYTGTFFFRTQWAGQDCSTAVPPVTTHVLTLRQGGVAVSVTTEDGDPLDGSGPGPCQPFANEFPQSALEAPFGDATFTVQGRDSTGTPQFEETFDTFIGAGISNPELHFDVNSLAPDAGVPDAGVSDAGVPDAT